MPLLSVFCLSALDGIIAPRAPVNVGVFFSGFWLAVMVGAIATFLVSRWGRIQKASERMFSPPQPSIRQVPPNVTTFGTIPDQAPLQALSSGCLTILAEILSTIVLVSFVGVGVGSVLRAANVRPQQAPEEFWVGVLFAGILGLLVRSSIWNLNWIAVVWRRLFTPPNSALSKASPPSNYYLSAKPTQSAYDIAVGGCAEIPLRVLLQFVLLGLLVWAVRAMILYLFG